MSDTIYSNSKNRTYDTFRTFTACKADCSLFLKTDRSRPTVKILVTQQDWFVRLQTQKHTHLTTVDQVTYTVCPRKNGPPKYNGKSHKFYSDPVWGKQQLQGRHV